MRFPFSKLKMTLKGRYFDDISSLKQFQCFDFLGNAAMFTGTGVRIINSWLQKVIETEVNRG